MLIVYWATTGPVPNCLLGCVIITVIVGDVRYTMKIILFNCKPIPYRPRHNVKGIKCSLTLSFYH